MSSTLACWIAVIDLKFLRSFCLRLGPNPSTPSSLELNLSIPVAGLQKNDKHQTNELLFGDPLRVIDLPRQSEEFFLLHRIQDEVHRFAITFHRQVRSKNSFSSKLDGVEGLGPKRKQKLLKHFKSMTAIQKATVEDIHSLGIPEKVAEALLDKLNDNN